MAMTENKELAYGYFSQTLLPDYVEEHRLGWHVVYDARGHFEEPHTNRRIGCGTIEVGNYLHAMTRPTIVPAAFFDANVNIIGPSGNLAGVLFCEKEGFSPLFKAVNLANRFDLMIVSTKGVSVTAARRLIDDICGDHHLPLFVLHDFDVAGFLILERCSAIPGGINFQALSGSSTWGWGLPTSRALNGSRRRRPGQARRCSLSTRRKWRDRRGDRDSAQ
jgi:hypothetical protein